MSLGLLLTECHSAPSRTPHEEREAKSTKLASTSTLNSTPSTQILERILSGGPVKRVQKFCEFTHSFSLNIRSIVR